MQAIVGPRHAGKLSGSTPFGSGLRPTMLGKRGPPVLVQARLDTVREDVLYLGVGVGMAQRAA